MRFMLKTRKNMCIFGIQHVFLHSYLISLLVLMMVRYFYCKKSQKYWLKKSYILVIFRNYISEIVICSDVWCHWADFLKSWLDAGHAVMQKVGLLRFLSGLHNSFSESDTKTTPNRPHVQIRHATSERNSVLVNPRVLCCVQYLRPAAH